MATSAHPLAPHHLPAFITAPGETDVLFRVMVVVVVAAIVLIGVFYFKLHALPEQKAHKGQKFQYDLVAVLALLSLFTHNHIFWIIGLLFAFVPIPDFLTPMTGMARSLETMASRTRRTVKIEAPEAESISITPTVIKEAPARNVEPIHSIEKERAHG